MKSAITRLIFGVTAQGNERGRERLANCDEKFLQLEFGFVESY